MSKKKSSAAPVKPKAQASKPSQPASNAWIHFERLETWLKGHRLFAIAAIVLLSLAVRVVYFNQAKETKIMSYHQWVNSDMNFFDLWARGVAGGDWLNQKAPHPEHMWHREMIELYFKKYPQDSLAYAEMMKKDTSLTLQKAIINDWYGGKTFHQEPLYTYLVALTYKFIGDESWHVFLWQLFLGILVNLLIFLLAAKYTNDTTALMAGLMAVFCGPMLCYDMVLLRTSFTVFIFLAALWMFEQALEKPSPWRLLASGVVTALAVLTQSYAILFFVFCLFLLKVYLKETPKTLRAAALMTLGFLLMVSPVIYRNLVVGASPTSIASIGGAAFIVANVKGTDPTVPFMIINESFVDIMHQTHGAMMATIKASIATYSSLWDYVMFEFAKVKTAFFWYEMPNNMNYYLYQELAPVLKYMAVTHFVIAPLCLVGLGFWVAERKKECLPWLALWLVAMVPLLYGTSLSRYRTGFMAASIIPAAYALFSIAKTLVLPGFGRKAAVIALTCLVFYLTSNAVSRNRPNISFNEYALLYQQFYVDDIIRYKEEKNFEACIKVYDSFMPFEPEYLKKAPVRRLQNQEEKNTADMFMNLHGDRGAVLRAMGRNVEAAEALKRAEALQSAIDRF